MNGNDTYLYNGTYAYKEGQRWILVGDIEKYFPTIPCKEYEKLLEKYPELRLVEVEARKPKSMEIIEKYKEDTFEEDDNEKVLTRNEAFKGIFNKGNKKWV